MSTLGKLARGVASGLSQYYGIQAQQQIDERKARVLADRQMALESFKSQLNMTEKTHEANAQAGLERVKTDEKVRGEKALLEPKADAEIRVNSAKEKAEFDTWKAKQPIELRNTLTIEDFRQDRQDRRTEFTENQQNSRTVVARGVNATGDVAFTTARGDTKIMGGMKPTPSGKDDSDPFGLNGSTAAAPAAPPAADHQQFDQALSEAAMKAAQGDPRYKGKSTEEIRRDVIQLFKRNNLPAPDQ